MDLKTFKLAELNPASYNPRKNLKPGDKEYEKIKSSIEAFGFVEPLIVNIRDGANRIVGGHQRYKVLKELGVKDTKCVVVDYDDITEKACNVALNKISGDWEFAALADLLTELDTGAFDMELTGFDEDELQKMMDWTPDGVGGKAEEDDFDAEAEAEAITEPTTKRGDIWLLGKHRVMCGDSTIPEDVSRLLAGAIPELMVTDPPYGVEYDPTRRFVVGQQDIKGGAVGVVANDDNADWRAAYSLFPGHIAYVWHADLFTDVVMDGLVEAAFLPRTLIIWAKSQMVPSPYGINADQVEALGLYHHQHEAAWYAIRKGQSVKWIGGRSQTTLWPIDKPAKNESGHSTQKPVECMGRPIENHNVAAVYDPFVGSGTTIVAAEQLNRVCYGMEISPVYCDVIVKRWETLTGKTAILQGN